MTSKNEHTGDNLISKPTNELFRNGYDAITWGSIKPKKQEECPCHDEKKEKESVKRASFPVEEEGCCGECC